ncbi:EH signature domain-containing protein [Marinibacterium sp. SX1]|uniref:EH signature domain-containing protein n=1 Tax=Marinibacterium sp. SX1 TaxID=3388424 RepID=UPI003D1832E5
MTDARTQRQGLRSLVGRLPPLRRRALPPLDQLRRSVDGIIARWPDAVRRPDDRDREKLARDMLIRTRTWSWQDITTQRVISAAVAVFDPERRERPDLAPVRDFYMSEIGTCEPGAFLDGMLGIYVDSFTPGAEHTRRLAIALARRKTDLGGRHLKLTRALPGLFHPREAPGQLAQVMLDADDAYDELKSIGMPTPHVSGLAQAAQKTFLERLAPELAGADARTKLFNWLTPENGPTLQNGAGPAVEALLSAWRERTPPDDLRNELAEQIIAAWNDPRLHSGGIWSGFNPELRAILLRWLTHQDMKFFCNMVTATQDSHMWPPRRDFWLELFEDGMIEEAWVAFGSQAREYARNHLVRNGMTDMDRRFGRQLDRGGGTSLLIMRIGNKIVVDGCHSYKTHIFRDSDSKAPELYKLTYHCDSIMRASTKSKSHSAIRHWQQWVLQNV